MMARMKQDMYWLPSVVLFALGIVDLVRGFMHTFNIHWAAENIAKLDLSAAPQDQLFLLGTFGISNFLTGFIYLLISTRAKEQSPWIILLIPSAYLLGIIGFKFAGLTKAAEFNGQYFMFVYLAVCVLTFIVFLVQRRTLNKTH